MNRQKQSWGKAGVSMGDVFAHSPIWREEEAATEGRVLCTAVPGASRASWPSAHTAAAGHELAQTAAPPEGPVGKTEPMPRPEQCPQTG